VRQGFRSDRTYRAKRAAGTSTERIYRISMEIAQRAVDRELFNKIRILIERDLLELHGLDSDAFGFICRTCGCAYCINCWENVRETFDEGFHDDTRGRCPKGHEQMLRD
jgi:hypothetical protein